MDAHGDELTLWSTGEPAVRRSEGEWAVLAGRIRLAANGLGEALPLCLPGEPEECGRSAQQHALAWAAEAKARAHRFIEVNAPSEHTASAFAGPFYKDRLGVLRTEH
ncbi:hypothetical protein [Streptomyces sp. NPDC097619]|uniref:hypothetical protein n=1 Tax=Streptomyces sp. NPDC097619 TaxID=3157228 RepID=UPI003317FD0E